MLMAARDKDCGTTRTMMSTLWKKKPLTRLGCTAHTLAGMLQWLEDNGEAVDAAIMGIAFDQDGTAHTTSPVGGPTRAQGGGAAGRGGGHARPRPSAPRDGGRTRSGLGDAL
jgi:hypothetical protein